LKNYDKFDNRTVCGLYYGIGKLDMRAGTIISGQIALIPGSRISAVKEIDSVYRSRQSNCIENSFTTVLRPFSHIVVSGEKFFRQPDAIPIESGEEILRNQINWQTIYGKSAKAYLLGRNKRCATCILI
jgi:hypothetical protein